ncbi:MAG: trehalase family glycosidase [Bacteroidota bacterium]
MKKLLFVTVLIFSLISCSDNKKAVNDDTEKNNSFAVLYPNVRTGNRTFDIAYRIAVGDLFSNIQEHKSELTGNEEPVIIAGIDYSRPWVRDAAINSWNGGSFIVPEIAENTLFSIVKKRDNGKYRIIGQYWDAIIWVTGAWNHYLVTGDRAFLEKAFNVSKDEIEFLERTEFNRDYHLFRGLGWSDGVAEYPEKYAKAGGHSDAFRWPEFNKEKAATTGHGIPMMSTYANTLYYNAYKILKKMSDELGGNEGEKWDDKAAKIKEAINNHLWNDSTGQYNLYIDEDGICEIQEALANTYAIMFGITNDKQTKLIFENQHISSAGITCGWPELPRFKEMNKDGMTFGRHNVTVWPHIQGMWADVAAKNREVDKFAFEFRTLANHAVRDMQFSEMYHPVSGARYGGMQIGGGGKIVLWQSTRRQTWAATAFIRMVYNGIFGIRLNNEGVEFFPVVPKELSDIKMTNLKYRNMILNISIKGSGTEIESFKVNGAEKDKASISNRERGVQNIEIRLN